MRHSRYKYFSDLGHAKKFLDGGIFHQTLGFFRDYEDAAAKQVIGDQFESTRIYRPADGLPINDLTHGKSFNLDMGFEATVRAGEIYVFCVSLALTEELGREFRAKACVEILRPAIFVKRWLAALPKNARYFAKKVKYYRPEDVPGNVWPQPELIATTKLAGYAYQQEYRLGFSVTGALEFGQTNLQLVDRRVRPKAQPHEHDQLTLEAGDLRDICMFHEWPT
jgi:hypothetical protein